MKVAIFGLGYVGAVTAACLADNGHSVWGVDVDAGKVAKIAAGESPVVEPGIDELIARGRAAGTLHATSDAAEAIAHADVSLVCVGTPSTTAGGTDLAYIERAVRDIAAAMATAPPPAGGLHTVVVRSTVPPGTVDATVAAILAGAPLGPGWRVATAMCPEFLREGTGVADFFAPPFVVLGTNDPAAAQQLTDLFAFLGVTPRTVATRTAESLKYACNAFHATKVTFANEIGRLFRQFGVDSREVMDVFCDDRALNISPRYLKPGFAFGGSCLPKDLRSMLYLARMNGADLPLLTGTLQSNQVAIRDVLDRIVGTPGRRVALLGLSFKRDTDDLRESPYVELAEVLIGKGFDVRIYDPIVNPAGLRGTNRAHVESRLPHLNRLLRPTAEQALDGSDLALVSCATPEVVTALLAQQPPRVIDLAGGLGDQIEAMPGYEGVSW